MLVMIKADGTANVVSGEQIYQGENNASIMYVIGAFAEGSILSAAFRLPNGAATEEIIVPNIAEPENLPIAQTFGLSAWGYSIGAALTNYYGRVYYTLRVYTAGQEIVATTQGSFEVIRGTPPVLPVEPTANTYQSILEYLAYLNGKVNNILDGQSFTVSGVTADASHNIPLINVDLPATPQAGMIYLSDDDVVEEQPQEELIDVQSTETQGGDNSETIEVEQTVESATGDNSETVESATVEETQNGDNSEIVATESPTETQGGNNVEV